MRIYVRVSPRSSQRKLEKISENEYKAWVFAPADKGRANEELLKLLADHFKVSKRNIVMVAGKTARVKIIDVP